MARFHFAYLWFKTLHFAHLNFNLLPICYPPLLKSRVKMYFTFTFMSLSPLKTKNNRKNSNKQDQRGGFVAWVQEHTSSWYEQS